jgi:hypothetical protein
MGQHNKINVCKECVVWAGGGDLTPWFLSQKQFYE